MLLATPTHLTFPVDRVSPGQLGSSFRILRNIIQQDGALRGLYRGFTPNLIGNSVGWGAFFLWYGKAQDALQIYYGPEKRLTSYDYFLTSGAAGKS